jgi:hypothetical protein
VRDGRILQMRRVARDSNGELRLSLNSSAFGRGDVDVQFAGYTWRGETVPAGWIRLGMQERRSMLRPKGIARGLPIRPCAASPPAAH